MLDARVSTPLVRKGPVENAVDNFVHNHSVGADVTWHGDMGWLFP